MALLEVMDGSFMAVPRIVVTDADTNEQTEIQQGHAPSNGGDAPSARTDAADHGKRKGRARGRNLKNSDRGN